MNSTIWRPGRIALYQARQTRHRKETIAKIKILRLRSVLPRTTEIMVDRRVSDPLDRLSHIVYFWRQLRVRLLVKVLDLVLDLAQVKVKKCIFLKLSRLDALVQPRCQWIQVGFANVLFAASCDEHIPFQHNLFEQRSEVWR